MFETADVSGGVFFLKFREESRGCEGFFEVSCLIEFLADCEYLFFAEIFDIFPVFLRYFFDVFGSCAANLYLFLKETRLNPFKPGCRMFQDIIRDFRCYL